MKGRLSQIAQDPKRPGCQQDALIVARIPAAPQTWLAVLSRNGGRAFVDRVEVVFYFRTFSTLQTE